MPGMGMGFGFRMEPRQKLRLEQIMTLSQIQTIRTEGSKDTSEQVKLLERFLEEIDRNVYKDPEEFHYRCIKRVKKDDRSESIVALVKSLRALIDNYAPADIMGVKQILQYGIDCYEKRGWIPSAEYEDMAVIFGARKQPETKQIVFNALKKNMEKNEQSDFSELLLQIAENKAVDDANFIKVIERAEKAKPKTIHSLACNLGMVLPKNADYSHFQAAIDTIFAFEELVPDNYHESITAMVRDFVSNPGMPELARKYTAMPLPLLAAASKFSPSEEQLNKLESFCKEERVLHSRDANRHLIIGAHQLTMYFSRGADVFAHTLSLAKNSEQLEKLYAEIASALMFSCHRDIGGYNFGAKTFEELYSGLRQRRITSGLSAVPISTDHLKKLVDESDRIPSKFLTILSTLGDVYKKNYPEGLPILARIAERVIDNDFTKWRYSHEKAAAQLADAANSKAWQENIFRTHVLKCTDAVKQKLDAVRMIGQEAREAYKNMHGDPKQNIEYAEKELSNIRILLQDPNTPDKKALGWKASSLRAKYNLAKCLELFDIEPQQIELSRGFFREKARDKKYEMLREFMERALACLNSPDMENLESISIEETDNYMQVFNVGVEPVQSCQRWTEPTGYNKCLLAYVADANKKVFYTRTRHGDTLARTVVRLLPYEIITLLLEPTYSTQWNNDYAKALVSTILEKAAKISEELGMPVNVGYTDRRGQYGHVFSEIADYNFVRLMSDELYLTLPESINHFEYSDALGGCLKSGSRIEQTLNYIIIEPDEKEPDEE
ncbi:MAG: hypothetical protein QXM31_02260 [Candidatus Woesearchaeota archaeon]